MKFYGTTNKGLVRNVNQDAYALEVLPDFNIKILIVCDGMGGANAGHIASKYAIEECVSEIKKALRADLSAHDIKNILENAVKYANSFVYNIAMQEPEFKGMGTTLVSAIILNDYIIVANVGDSRGYFINHEVIKQITVDHSLVEEMRQQGRLTDDEARHHPKKNYITRAIGVDNTVVVDVFEYKKDNFGYILLCSDGVCNMIEDQEIQEYIMNDDSLEDSCEKIIAKANKNGGFDNSTIVIAKL